MVILGSKEKNLNRLLQMKWTASLFFKLYVTELSTQNANLSSSLILKPDDCVRIFPCLMKRNTMISGNNEVSRSQRYTSPTPAFERRLIRF